MGGNPKKANAQEAFHGEINPDCVEDNGSHCFQRNLVSLVACEILSSVGN